MSEKKYVEYKYVKNNSLVQFNEFTGEVWNL